LMSVVTVVPPAQPPLPPGALPPVHINPTTPPTFV
jgi:hypothetical protein